MRREEKNTAPPLGRQQSQPRVSPNCSISPTHLPSRLKYIDGKRLYIYVPGFTAYIYHGISENRLPPVNQIHPLGFFKLQGHHFRPKRPAPLPSTSAASRFAPDLILSGYPHGELKGTLLESKALKKHNNVGKPIINHPIFDGLYRLFMVMTGDGLLLF